MTSAQQLELTASARPKPPGHPEAVKAGCICPVQDNHGGRGNGWKKASGEVLFWYDEECPLHGGDNAQPVSMETWCEKDITDKIYDGTAL